MSITITRNKIRSKIQPMPIGWAGKLTFSGNPIACAVAQAALNVLIDEGLIDNAREMGDYLRDLLAQIDSPHIKTVSGRGVLIGVELHASAGGARRFCEALQHEGVLCKETMTTLSALRRR